MSNYQFVNVDLSEVIRIRYEELQCDPDEWHLFVEETVTAGYKVSVSAMKDGGSYVVSVTDKAPDSVNEGKILSCFAGNIPDAFRDISIFLRLVWETGAAYRDVQERLKKEVKAELEAYRRFADKNRSKNG